MQWVRDSGQRKGLKEGIRAKEGIRQRRVSGKGRYPSKGGYPAKEGIRQRRVSGKGGYPAKEGIRANEHHQNPECMDGNNNLHNPSRGIALYQ
jgi:hypothetical protein